MTIRFITLPAINRRVSLGQYIEAVKMAKANPSSEFKHGFTTWWPTTGADIVKQFRQGMQERINANIPYCQR